MQKQKFESKSESQPKLTRMRARDKHITFVQPKKKNETIQHGKKDRSSMRHSFHQSSAGNFIGNGFDPSSSTGQLGQHRPTISRERSFIRPQSTFAHTQFEENPESVTNFQRQRSFVHSGQLQNQSKEHQQKRRSGMSMNHRGKPAMEIYRPPTLRGSNPFESNGETFNAVRTSEGFYDSQGYFHPNSNHSQHQILNRRPGLNIHAKEFVSFQGASSLHHSKSSSNVSMFQHGKFPDGLQHSKSGYNLRVGGSKQEALTTLSKVHFSENKENDPDAKQLGMTTRTPQSATGLLGTLQSPIKRSKSLGPADLRHVLETTHDPLASIGPFPQEVHRAISEAMNDPNKQSARQLMEVVRHMFLRVIEASRHSEPTARICISIIEKEKGETFLETLLNTCQEYYQERDRLLRNSHGTPYPGYVISHPRWIAFMSFLNEMYTQLKRHHTQLMTVRMKNSETSPGLHLLTLLAQCCYICLREHSVNSLSETECLFFVLTAVGKDIEMKLPQYMARVMAAARDAFLTTVHVAAVRKTLLQLIEMHAARWHLTAPAVMYYYPGSGAK